MSEHGTKSTLYIKYDDRNLQVDQIYLKTNCANRYMYCMFNYYVLDYVIFAFLQVCRSREDTENLVSY